MRNNLHLLLCASLLLGLAACGKDAAIGPDPGSSTGADATTSGLDAAATEGEDTGTATTADTGTIAAGDTGLASDPDASVVAPDAGTMTPDTGVATADAGGPPSGHTLVLGGVNHKPGNTDPLNNCVACHGADLKGDLGPSCYSCHDSKDHTRNRNGVMHRTGTTTTCNACHGPGNTGGLGPACSKCH